MWASWTSRQKYKREADWKEDGERSERAWILSDNISGVSDSEGYWYYPQYPILFIDGNTKNALCPEMHRSQNAMHPTGKISDQDVFFLVFVLSSTKI